MKRSGQKANAGSQPSGSNPKKPTTASSPSESYPPASGSSLPNIFAALFGAFLGLCLLKFGGLPIMEKYVQTPANFTEAMASTPWPTAWAYRMLGVIVVLGIIVAGKSVEFFPSIFKKIREAWPLFLPAAWLLWQFVANQSSISRELSTLTMRHYTACVVCFYLGVFALSRLPTLWPFWSGLFAGFLFVVAIGWDDRFGGLEQSRQFFFKQQQLYPDQIYPPEFVKKVMSTRIYATLFYPNTLAGVFLLLLPPMFLTAMNTSRRFRLGSSSRWQTITFLILIAAACLLFAPSPGWILFALVGLCSVLPISPWITPALVTLASLACLYWSGSKTGWLLILGLGLIVLLRVRIAKRIKVATVAIILLAGIGGFFVRHALFFQKGATSVSARFDYWRAALQTAQAHPILGTGPGTFAIPYQAVKRPESEMARLAHNDYLEQASDSGLPGFILYLTFIVTALIFAFKKVGSDPNWEVFAIWLGLLGWSVQCLMEFSLFIPALSWTAFALFGRILTKNKLNPLNE